MTQVLIVIPSRFQSSRLPGKPLADIAGKPMIQRVYEQARKTQLYQNGTPIIIATDHPDIANTAKAFGAQVVITRKTHPTGTDRLAEVATQLDLDDNCIVVNVQGDEPLIPPEVIEQVANNLTKHDNFDMATLSTTIQSTTELTDNACVKVVCDQYGKALYFSRSAIPALQSKAVPALEAYPEGFLPARHIGIYAYRAATLKQFPTWQQPHIERCEHLEQLRMLYQGYSIHVETSCLPVPSGVDTPENLKQISTLFQINKIL